MNSIFSVDISVMSEPQRIRDVFLGFDNFLEDLCKPLRIGASYICSPSPESLITVFLSDDIKKFLMIIRVESTSATEIIRITEHINNKLKENGIHANLVNSFNKL
ncbi:hypothetical protein [Acidianus brierleyi]|uniref:Uncharacterized protein n=1 Tax=Acidianus brierleyi TaxID=41673 RepID=A0A2U9IG81_9CREN|nr:hypothetical protein [Acidianus brierleyi]AWR94965.1 hypothetical protein DFR85_10530 [Acidianus brierleyi]